ncbi:hypothetical protein C8Q79DRAFT_899633 [Trametes meyenii]|nr:hypothetical protein C8Q79DRAFT_899633 [Trametes meyenii]
MAGLTEDALLHILTFSDAKTLCALISTCRTLHRHGAKYLIEDEVILSQNRDVKSFFLFMTCDNLRRIPYLSRLVVSIDPATSHSRGLGDPMEAAKALKELFLQVARGGNLVELAMHRTEAILELCHELPDTVCALGTLRSLILHQVGPLTGNMLQSLTIPLVSVAIEEESDFGMPIPTIRNPTYLLCGTQETLQELSVTFFEVTGPNTFCYPNVHTLSFRYTEILDTQHYVHAFPNLQHLKTAYGAPFEIEEDEELAELREKNRRAQQLFGTWPSLRCYNGSLQDLYVLGTLCHISSISIDYDEHYVLLPPALRAVLDDARPVHLDLRLSMTPTWLFHLEFYTAFSRPSAQTLSHLELSFYIEGENTPEFGKDVGKGLENVVSHVVASLRCLSSFRFVVTCGGDGLELRQGAENPCEKPPCAIDILAGDLGAYARRCREANPTGTLKSVAITMFMCHTLEGVTVQLGPAYQYDPGKGKSDSPPRSSLIDC